MMNPTIIDFHSHMFPDRLAAGAIASLSEKAHIPAFTDGTAADTARVMERAGVSRHVVLNIAVSERQQRSVNDFAIASNGGRVIAFGSVHPFSEKAVFELERLREHGIRGVKFHNEYQDFFVNDPVAYPVYKKCAALGLIMVFHGGVDLGFEPPVKASPERFAIVCRDLKYERMVFAHMGGYKMSDQALEFLTDSGCYIETSFSADGKLASETALALIRAFTAERVLFGSDCPWEDPARSIAFVNALPLTDSERSAIFSGNALGLLGEQCSKSDTL